MRMQAEKKLRQEFRVRRDKPKLREYLATRALLHYYEDDLERGEAVQVKALCERNLSSENQARLLFRIMRERSNDRLVAAVLDEADKSERQFLYDKYKLNLPMVRISVKLHASPNCLLYWQNALLEEIAALMFFQLPRRAFFSILKLQVLAECLGDMLRLHGQYNSGMFDSRTVRELARRKEMYEQARKVLERCRDGDGTVMGQVVKARLEDRSASIDSLARKLGISVGMVCKQLDMFEKAYLPG